MQIAKAIAVVSLTLSMAVPVAWPARQEQPAAPQQPQAAKAQAPSKSVSTVFGRIIKSSGTYVLEESASRAHYTLDDQKRARQYNGRVVAITGMVNAESKSIEVQKIEVAA